MQNVSNQVLHSCIYSCERGVFCLTFLIEADDPRLKSWISVRLNFYETWLKNCIFLIQYSLLFLYFSLEDKACSSDGVSRVVIITVLAEMLSQLPTFSLLSCFGMNQEWITSCCKTLYLKRVPVVVSKYFVELMLKFE